MHTQAGRVTAVDFVNVPSYLLAQEVEVALHPTLTRVWSRSGRAGQPSLSASGEAASW